MPQSFTSHVRDWREMAEFDPLRAISGERREWDLEEFFATATPHVEQLYTIAASLALPKHNERALEFGCGIGRFLRHFENRFCEVWGVDVSADMLKQAAVHAPRSKLCLSVGPELGFPDDYFDLVYSFLVLQHLPEQRLVEQYIREFIRTLQPGGLAAFQMPFHLSVRWKIQPRRRIYHLLRSLGIAPARLQSWGLIPMSMITVSESAIERVIAGAGGVLRRKIYLGGTDGAMYFCTK